MKKNKVGADWRNQDRHQSRESSVYENPIPSREYLMEYLSERGRVMTADRLAEELDLHGDGHEGLRRRLEAMVRDGQLVRNRRDGYGPVDKLDLIRGRVIGHPDGYGFVVPEDGSEDLYLSSRQMRGLMHGDKGLFRVTGVDRRGRLEGSLVEILERNTHQVVGRYFVENNIAILVPDNQRVQHDILIPPEHRGKAKVGQIVVAELLEQPSKRSRPVGRIVEVLGDHMGPGMEIDIAIRSHDIPYQWPAGVEEQAAAFGTEVPKRARQGRRDLRKLPLVTIDGADAKDFDDAVYCEATPKGWRLLVAIADVSAYVAVGSALDDEAHNRSTSVYFPGRVVPMLPETLSNGLCSINPDVDRLCLVCDMLVDKDGEVTRAQFYEGLMRSHARFTYDEVWGILSREDLDAHKARAGLVPRLDNLYSLYKAFRKARNRRGAIDFETTETQIIFGRGKKIEYIEPRQRNDAHRIIEECMVAANVCAAKFLARRKLPTLYRVHDLPKTDRLKDLREFLRELGLRMGGGEQPAPGDYARLLKRVAGRPDAHLIQTVLLRSMSQAVYSPDNIGHFGLAHEYYAHFTSPIRRYPDLLVHRAIKHALQGGKAADFNYSPAAMVALGDHCSANERRADDATRDAELWLKCEYMQDKVGETFDGIITGVTSFGIFVELNDIYVEGLVHVTALSNDYYHFEPAHHRLVGERRNLVYRLGDPVAVRVSRVNLDERKVDFDLAQTSAGSESPGDAAGRPKGKRSGRSRKAGSRTADDKAPAPKGKRRGGSGRRSRGKKRTAG